MPAPEGFNPDFAACPKCGGDMWDNRTTKRSPKAPDFKCKDKACDGAVWMQAKGASGRGGASGSGGAPMPTLTPEQKKAGRDKVFADYFGLMHMVAERMTATAKASGLTVTMENIQAATYSVYSTMDKKRFIADPASKPAAAPPPPRRLPPPPQPEPEEEYVLEQDDLPF